MDNVLHLGMDRGGGVGVCISYSVSPGCDEQRTDQEHDKGGPVVELEGQVVDRNGLSSELQLGRN